MIRINLTGDYEIKGTDKTLAHAELAQLDALIGALRGSVEADRDPFLKSVAALTTKLKRRDYKQVALQITSKLTGNTLTHNFSIVEI